MRGREIHVVGRTIYVAGGESGLLTLRDGATRSAIHLVTVGDTFFSPSFLNITRGDSVRWSNPGTIFLHNVRSCTPAQLGCGVSTATESFTSGAVASAFLFGHTFNLVGANPYVCQTHTIFMTGNVNVLAPVAAPPGVPDGSGASAPLSVGKLTVDGSNLSIGFDTATCSAADHQIIFGTQAQLPVVPGGTYGVSGSVCNIGIATPFNWTGSPVPAAGTFIWLLVLAENGNAEGSWGKDGGNAERNGTGVGGSSGQCGLGAKDLSNACGQ